MSGCPRGGDCRSCMDLGGPVVCHCLGVTEEQLVSAVAAFDLQTLNEVRRRTGAGTGCNACHQRIRFHLESYSSSSYEICSAR
jgi:bacterioferritin-associated ferredoxin